MRAERNETIARLSTNGFFPVLMSSGKGRKKIVEVHGAADEIIDHLNEAEIDLKMDEVKTMVSTIVSFGQPSQSQLLLSEKLLLGSEQLGFRDLKHNNEIRSAFFKQKSLVGLGMLVPNLIRGQDNLILEIMLPPDLDKKENMVHASRILAPLLIISHHIVFNFDSEDVKKSLMESISVLLESSALYDYSYLKEHDHDDI